MQFPKQGSLADKIAAHMAKYNKRNYSEIVVAMQLKGHSEGGIEHALSDMRKTGMLEHDGARYRLSDPLRKHYGHIEPVEDEVRDVVQPRSTPEFRPIQPKNQFWNAYRREPIREISFKTAGAPALSFVQPV